MNLKPCPCGETPKKLHISHNGQGDKWMECSGSCCGSWLVEFKAYYHDENSEECMGLAIEEWNEAKRGKNDNIKN